MKDILDGEYTGELTPEEVIEQFKYRAGIHLSYIELLEKQPNAGWEVYGTKKFHEWAINGYEWGIEYIRKYLQGDKPAEEEPVKKKWYTSKTVWFNALAAVSIIIQAATGEPWLDAEAQGAIIVVVNLILRAITGKPLEK